MAGNSDCSLSRLHQSGLVSPDLGQPALIALALTMGLAPLVIQRNHWAEWPFGHRDRHIAATEVSIRAQSGGLHDHVILCGCGRVGRLVATVLESADIASIAIGTGSDTVSCRA